MCSTRSTTGWRSWRRPKGSINRLRSGREWARRLVVEHAYRQRSDYDVVWWLRADDPFQLRADYARLADSLGMPEGATSDEGGVIDFVGRWLETNQRWLLVFDHAQGPADDVGEYLVMRTGARAHHLAQPELAAPWQRS